MSTNDNLENFSAERKKQEWQKPTLVELNTEKTQGGGGDNDEGITNKTGS